MSSDDKPTATEAEPSTGLAKSLADRLTFPDNKSKSTAPNPTAATFTPGKFNWADEVTTPTNESELDLGSAKMPETETAGATTDGAKDGSLEAAQTDGATSWMGGSSGLDEPEFDVNVKLADLQEDPNNPLFSAQTFEQLNL